MIFITLLIRQLLLKKYNYKAKIETYSVCYITRGLDTGLSEVLFSVGNVMSL